MSVGHSNIAHFFLLLLSKTWAMYISPQRIKFLCFCRFNLQVQATGMLLNQSAERAAFQNLFPCSEPLRHSPFHYLWPWSASLNFLSSFWPWLVSFQFIVFPPPTHTFLAMPPPGLNYFFFLCFLSTIFRIYNLGIKKKINIYLSAHKTVFIYSRMRYKNS